MLPYLFYFVIGGILVASVVYLGSRGNSLLAALVANLPVLFLLSVFLIHRYSGTDGSIAYAKTVLMMVPVFAFYIVITILLLPHLGIPKALFPGLTVYLVPLIAKKIGEHKIHKITSEPEGDKHHA